MASVTRNGRLYSYKSVRRNGKVTSEYRGSGDFAAFYAMLDDDERGHREAERERRKAERDRLDAVERPLKDFFEQVDHLTRAALFVNGFHQHKSEWRRARA